MNILSRPYLLNISGPYAVGKDSILNSIISSYPTSIHRVSTITTRLVSRDLDPSYTHLNLEDLKHRSSIENWIVNYQISGEVAYGTNIDEIKEKGESGLICIHSIYPSSEGAGKLRELFGKKLFSIGLCATNGGIEKQIEETRKRLINRGRDSMETIEVRLKHQIQPMEYILNNPVVETSDGFLHVFDKIFTNDNLDKTIKDVLFLFQSIFLRSNNG